MTTIISKCRSCGSDNTRDVFELGNQVLSGVFVSENLDSVTSGPLTLFQCNQCHLVQLRLSFRINRVYEQSS